MSGKSSRDKGVRYENDVYNYLCRQLGEDNVVKKNRSGYDGDDLEIYGVISVECKNHKSLSLAAWVDQAADNAGLNHPVVFHKRKGKGSVSGHYVTMSAETFVELSKYATEGS